MSRAQFSKLRNRISGIKVFRYSIIHNQNLQSIGLSVLKLLEVWYYDIILFNDGHVLHIMSEIVAVHRRMNMVLDVYHGHMIPGDEYCLNFLTSVLELRKTPEKISTKKLTRTGTNPGPLGEWQRQYA